MFKSMCVCGQYSKRLVTNTNGQQSEVCANCGRSGPSIKMPEVNMDKVNREMSGTMQFDVDTEIAIIRNQMKTLETRLYEIERGSKKEVEKKFVINNKPRVRKMHFRTYLDGSDSPHNMGGMTVILRQQGDYTTIGLSVCSPTDNFDKWEGSKQAHKALNNAKPIQAIFTNKQQVLEYLWVNHRMPSGQSLRSFFRGLSLEA